MNPKTWEILDDHFSQVERIAGRALTKAVEAPSDDEIARAAKELDARFADDYVAFLQRYGGATVGSLPVYGLRPVEATGDPWSVVQVTHQFQKQGWPGTDGWYIISDDGFGNPIGIAADGRVMILYHDVGQISVLADSFEDFLMRHCLEGS